MKRILVPMVVICLMALAAVAQYGRPAAQSAGKDFHITATYIEACSCTMFCPCYFNPHPTAHGEKHFCEAALVMKVDKGHYKNVKLDGVKVWIATDLGGNFGSGKGDWLALTFDTAVTEEQRKVMMDVLTQLYPLEFKFLGADSLPIEWNINERTGVAVARMGGGKGEVTLERWQGDDPSKESVLHNVKYFAAQSNTGFRMWKNKRLYYDHHGKKFEHRDSNGFLITIEFSGNAKQAVD